jgi:heat shock protein 5
LVEGLDLKETLIIAKLENLNINLFKKTIDPVEKIMLVGGLKKSKNS